MCLGSPWRVRFPDGPDGGRDYAGVFTWSPPPPYRPPPGVPTTPSALKARRGSDFVFRTTRVQYTAGVVAAEDVTLQGEARVALARVVAHNERHAAAAPPRPRPSATPPTARPSAAPCACAPRTTRALKLPPLRWDVWLDLLPGRRNSPGASSAPAPRWRPCWAARLVSLRFESGRVRYLRTEGEAGAPYEARALAALRHAARGPPAPLLPPRASFDGPRVLFEGQGRGHGEGLDVEAAKAATGLSSDASCSAPTKRSTVPRPRPPEQPSPDPVSPRNPR